MWQLALPRIKSTNLWGFDLATYLHISTSVNDSCAYDRFIFIFADNIFISDFFCYFRSALLIHKSLVFIFYEVVWLWKIMDE